MEKATLKDKVFFKTVEIIFFIIYGYFNPPNVLSKFKLILEHIDYNKKI